ncbi:fish-egg lectin-like isoform X2 [Thunnus maccoyii]|uniref:fish-egg lectin-like isoform X2 n=1 Tax=Thunnus maccoyii TaxID=8240 RepID=UPI001C4A8EA8|nr:fish-egg lectin-like isoform X2 [Thunnus maccoyii]
MKAVAVFLLVLCYLAVGHAWTCREAPQLYHVRQIDAGQGKVVARTSSNYAYFLSGSSWYRLGSTTLKHVSVGPAGMWGVDTSNRVCKYVAGNFVQSSGLSMQQVDAGGDGQVVGVTPSSYSTYCLRSSLALAYKAGSLSWNSLSRTMRYYSCGPLYGCWGVDSRSQVYVTQRFTPTSCGATGWTQVPGLTMRMVEVGTDGNVFGVTTNGSVYQRVGISHVRPQGTAWVSVSMCMPISHLSYDLGQLWVVTNSGMLLQCSH